MKIQCISKMCFRSALLIIWIPSTYYKEKSKFDTKWFCKIVRSGNWMESQTHLLTLSTGICWGTTILCQQRHTILSDLGGNLSTFIVKLRVGYFEFLWSMKGLNWDTPKIIVFLINIDHLMLIQNAELNEYFRMGKNQWLI